MIVLLYNENVRFDEMFLNFKICILYIIGLENDLIILMVWFYIMIYFDIIFLICVNFISIVLKCIYKNEYIIFILFIEVVLLSLLIYFKLE